MRVEPVQHAAAVLEASPLELNGTQAEKSRKRPFEVVVLPGYQLVQQFLSVNILLLHWERHRWN